MADSMTIVMFATRVNRNTRTNLVQSRSDDHANIHALATRFILASPDIIAEKWHCSRTMFHTFSLSSTIAHGRRTTS